MESWFAMFPRYRKGTHQWISTKKMHMWRFTPPGEKHPIHAEFIFCALDDQQAVADLMGLEVTGWWYNELRLLDPTVVGQAATRAGRYPNKAMGGCKWSGWLRGYQSVEQHERVSSVFRGSETGMSGPSIVSRAA